MRDEGHIGKLLIIPSMRAKLFFCYEKLVATQNIVEKNEFRKL